MGNKNHRGAREKVIGNLLGALLILASADAYLIVVSANNDSWCQRLEMDAAESGVIGAITRAIQLCWIP